MILSQNEANLLAWGYCRSKENIRIGLNKAKIFSCGELKNIYFINDIQEAIDLYIKYEKTFRRRLDMYNDDFINHCVVIKAIGLEE
jgi:hypothetical protein